LGGEEHGDVFAGALGHELDVGDPVPEQLLPPRGPAVGVDVVDEVRPAGQRLGRHRVEVADDDVGPQADLEQGVGAAVDGHQDRLELPDVGPQRLQVAAV